MRSDTDTPQLGVGRSGCVIDQLIAAGKAFHSRNWVLGTRGNFSAVISGEPWHFVITESGSHKGSLTRAAFVPVDASGQSLEKGRQPPAETALHRTILLERDANAVLHTHSVWSTMLSELYANSGGVTLDGFEMLKDLSSIKTHQHSEWLPILDNSEDYSALSLRMADLLRRRGEIHAVLLRKFGLYTWGKTVDDAIRHVDILEFLLEVLGRRLHILSQMEGGQHRTNPI